MYIKQPYCSDCGAAQTNHVLVKADALSSRYIFSFLEQATSKLSRALPPAAAQFFFEKIPATIAYALSSIGMGRMERAPGKGDNDRTRCLWEEAVRRGIIMEEYCIGRHRTGLFIAQWKNERIFFQAVPRPSGPESSSLVWMDNKKLMREYFSGAGIPVANGGVCRTWSRAKTLFDKLNKPLIIKPHFGSRSRHTTVHVESFNQYKTAFEKAKILSPWVIVEEELQGFVFRGTIIGGNVVAVMRREPPHVIGDGLSDIQKLVETENARPERKGPIFHEIHLGKEAEEELRRQKLTLADVPEKGRLVMLNQKVGRGSGASMTDVTDSVHSDNRLLLEKIAAVLGDPIVGVDFIMKDIGISWKNQMPAGVIECNSLPFIDLHHYPLNGKPRNVAGAIWDLIFPNSSANQKPSLLSSA